MLPYLNATLRGAIYHRSANALTWKNNGHAIAFHASQIATSNVEDHEAAVGEIDNLIELVNRTWEQRAEITPDYEAHQRAPLMVAYRLLPQTNCKQCGEPTRYSFAIKLVAAQQNLAACAPLCEPPHAAKLAALQELIVDVSVTDRCRGRPMCLPSLDRHYLTPLNTVVDGDDSPLSCHA